MINDLGVDPDDWFPYPSRGDNKDNKEYITDDYAPCDVEYEIPSLEDMPPEMLEVPTSVENPDLSDEIEEEKTMHQKMYEIATARYNPFSLGGSENCNSDVSCEEQKHSPWPGGGSEKYQSTE